MAPDAARFPEFDDNLRRALRRETELFFAGQLREDRSVHDLLRADYTFVNERLARHYGIPNVYGSHFRRVDARRRPAAGPARPRQHPDRHLLPAPHVAGGAREVAARGTCSAHRRRPPPPDIPELAEDDGGAERPATMRERMAQHRASPACSTCHAKIDPLGFALENFDAVGRWRTHDGNPAAPDGVGLPAGAAPPIDASGALPDGSPFDGPAAFRDALLREPWASEFAATVTEKLLTYALGRGLDHRDAPGRAEDPAGRRAGRIPLVVPDSRHRRERAVPDARAADAGRRPIRRGGSGRPCGADRYRGAGRHPGGRCGDTSARAGIAAAGIATSALGAARASRHRRRCGTGHGGPAAPVATAKADSP